jgi:hypothetical protein
LPRECNAGTGRSTRVRTYSWMVFALALVACKKDENPPTIAKPVETSSAAAVSAVSVEPPSTKAPSKDDARGCKVIGKLSKWRYGLAAASLGGVENEHVIVLGGHQHDAGDELADVDVFDVAKQTFRKGKPLPAPRAGHVAAELGNRRHVAIAGGNVASIELWDDVAQTYKTVGALPNAPVFGAVAGNDSKRTLIVGGDLQHKGAMSASAVFVTPEGMTPAESLPAGRVATGVVTNLRGQFIVFGGGEPLVYDDAAKKWSPASAHASPLKRYSAPSFPKGDLIALDRVAVVRADAVHWPNASGVWEKLPTLKNHAGGAAVMTSAGTRSPAST